MNRIEILAAACHLAVHGHDPTWDKAPEYMRSAAFHTIYFFETLDLPPEKMTLEYLAEVTHQVWLRDKTRCGWTYCETKNIEAKQHPDMVPYADLPECEKNKDRALISTYILFKQLLDK